MIIYVVGTYSYDNGDTLKAFKTLREAQEYRSSIASPVDNGNDTVYELDTNPFYWVKIEKVELV